MSLKSLIDLPTVLDVAIAPTSPLELGMTARYELDPASRRYRGTAVAFSAPVSGATQVRSTSIKKTRIRDQVVPSLREQLAARPANKKLAATYPPIKAYFAGRPGRRAAQATVHRPTEQQLQQAAVIHTAASAIGDYSVLAVARSFGINPRQAARWVNRLHRYGYLH